MAKVEIKGTDRAVEKFELIVNGARDKVKKFFSNLKEPLDKSSFKILFRGNSRDFYYKKCNDLYIVFVVLDDKTLGVSDFLTQTEFSDAKE